MKALIVGLGSMGKRRIRLLRGIDKNAEIIGVDTNPERRAQVEEMGCKTYRTIEEAAAGKAGGGFCLHIAGCPLSYNQRPFKL